MARLSKVEMKVKEGLISRIKELEDFKKRGFGKLLKVELEKVDLHFTQRNILAYIGLETYNREVYVQIIKLLEKLKREADNKKPDEVIAAEMLKRKEKESQRKADSILKDLGLSS